MAQRGGWKGLFRHMYSNGDYPFKFGKHMGTDTNGNMYYENTKDYPFGQHRWVEFQDVDNYDSSSVTPAWHGWLHQMHDAPGNETEAFLAAKLPHLNDKSAVPHALWNHQVGKTNPIPSTFNDWANQSQVRSRGWGVGNTVAGLPPGVPDQYWTQPGSPYYKGENPHSFLGQEKTEVNINTGGRVRGLWKSDNSVAVTKAEVGLDEVPKAFAQQMRDYEWMNPNPIEKPAAAAAKA
jgi:NADH:ubiquinone oxidoreductase subunit